MVRLAGFEHCSTVDWYDNIATVIFFSGCNLSCGYCHNHLLINPRYGRDYTIDEVLEILIENSTLIDCVVLSGGEPTMQPDRLMDVCMAIRETWPEWGIMLDTNGTNDKVIYELLDNHMIDRIALDVKTKLSRAEYSELTGVPSLYNLAGIMATMKWAKHFGVELEVRTTITPDHLNYDFLESVVFNTKHLADAFYLQQCNMSASLRPEWRELEDVTRDDLIFMGKTAKDLGMENVYIKTKGYGIEKINGPPPVRPS